MSLVVSTGSNLGNRQEHLSLAKTNLCRSYSLEEESRIYESPAVDYLNQPDFLNQILVFKLPDENPQSVISNILTIEKELGRVRNIDKGPRTVDIDILFWGREEISIEGLQVPHPRLFQRSFIVLPLKELKIFPYLSETFQFPNSFENKAWPLNND